MRPTTIRPQPKPTRDRQQAFRDVLDNIQSLGITARYNATLLYAAIMDDEDRRDHCHALRDACREILRITEPLDERGAR